VKAIAGAALIVRPSVTVATFGDDAPIWLHLDHFGGSLNLTEEWRGSGAIETYPALAMISFGWTLPDPKGAGDWPVAEI
jgi:hypothetical protein